MPDQTFIPSTAGRDSTRRAAPLMATLFFRVQPHLSMPKEMMFSYTATTVDRAAKDIKRKKSPPQICPPAIWEKTLGSVRNSRLGPESG